MKKNEMYVAPELEILNVMVECGFAGSDDGIDNPGGYDGTPAPDDI